MTVRYVLDASALLTLVLDPGQRGTALGSMLAPAELDAPDLLPHEVTNALRRRRERGAMSPTEATLARSGALRLPVRLWPHDAVADRVWELSGSLTAYDAAYVALAELLDIPLVTADERLARANGLRCEIHVA